MLLVKDIAKVSRQEEKKFVLVGSLSTHAIATDWPQANAAAAGVEVAIVSAEDLGLTADDFSYEAACLAAETRGLRYCPPKLAVALHRCASLDGHPAGPDLYIGMRPFVVDWAWCILKVNRRHDGVLGLDALMWSSPRQLPPDALLAFVVASPAEDRFAELQVAFRQLLIEWEASWHGDLPVEQKQALARVKHTRMRGLKAEADRLHDDIAITGEANGWFQMADSAIVELAKRISDLEDR